MHRKSTILVWDLDNQPGNNLHNVIYWSSYMRPESNRAFSLPQLVEENANHLKSKYLKLIYEFGEARVDGKRIIDHLQIRQNFSYWWITLFVEKCNYSKSPQIDNIIKLMALEQWLQENRYHKLQLVTANEGLAMACSLLAKKLLIEFDWKKGPNSRRNKSTVKRVYHTLPNIIQSPIWLLRNLLSNWPLKGVGVKEWKKTTATTTFVSYLFNLVPEAAKQGRYESRYWTTLTDLLEDNQYPTNWLHLYWKDDLLPSAKKARDFIQRLNHSQNDRQTHVTLASFLTVPRVIQTLHDWYKIHKLNKLICKQLQMKSAYLWPLFKKDCQDSMSGIPAISSLLYFNLFEKAMSELPPQKRGCYLQENQSWEFGFISAWQSSGHSKNLIGFPHSTVRYWDLRYFFDPRSYVRKGQCDIPLPNYVGVNGEVIKKAYIDGGYTQEEMIEVEALRYLYLSNLTIHQNKRGRGALKGRVVLVVGDYLKENTDKQLDLLSSALTSIDQSTCYIIKPHPACPVNMEDFPRLHGELSMKPITELLLMSDVVYSSAITSAAVDAYCVGLPVITLLDGQTLNLSPLRGSKGVHFVSSAKELATAINVAEANEPEQGKNYFYLDPNLPRWLEWLLDDVDKST